MFKKNTAVTGFPLSLVSKTDGSAITTGTPSGFYLLDGGTQGSIAGSFVHEGNGQWSVNLLAAEMNGDIVGLLFTHTSAVPVHFTIKTVTKLISELNDIAATAIVSSGAITTSGGAVSTVTTTGTATAVTTVNGLASGVITATSIAADAITAAKIADGAIDAATFAAGAINAAAIATDAITAAKIAADAIGASELAADAVTEIQSGLATSASIATLQADTDDIQARLPAALVSGRIDSSVGAMAANVVTASAIAADAIGASELAADAVTEIQSGLSTLTAAGVRTAVGLASANLDTQLDALPTNAELTTALGTADDATLAAIAALNNLSAAQVNVEVDTAIADAGLATATALMTVAGNIDTDFETLFTDVDDLATAIAGISSPTVADILAGVIEGSITLKGALRLALSALTGKASGGGTTTVVFRDTGDTKARITATVDSNGNRTAITRDITD